LFRIPHKRCGKGKTKMKPKQIIISENRKHGTKMVVYHRAVQGKKNRCGNPYIISETKHLGTKKRNIEE